MKVAGSVPELPDPSLHLDTSCAVRVEKGCSAEHPQSALGFL